MPLQFSSVQSLSCVILFASHGLQHARLPCLLETPRAYSNSCPLSWWWTGRPGMLQSMGCKELDTTERLNWTGAVNLGKVDSYPWRWGLHTYYPKPESPFCSCQGPFIFSKSHLFSYQCPSPIKMLHKPHPDFKHPLESHSSVKSYIYMSIICPFSC